MSNPLTENEKQMFRIAKIPITEDDSAEKISALEESETLVETEKARLMRISKRIAGISDD